MDDFIRSFPDGRVKNEHDGLIRELMEAIGPHPYRIHRQLVARGITLSLPTVTRRVRKWSPAYGQLNPAQS